MRNASFIKRILIILYDGLLLLGVVLVAWAPLYALLALTPEGFTDSGVGRAIRSGWLLLVVFGFYGWFWTHGGQTLGMRAWNLYLIDQHGKFPGWPLAAARFTAALASWFLVAGLAWLAGATQWYLGLGLGFTWMLVNSRRLAWHDIATGTRIVQLDKENIPA